MTKSKQKRLANRLGYWENKMNKIIYQLTGISKKHRNILKAQICHLKCIRTAINKGRMMILDGEGK
jgi:hypothetical protein